MRNLAVKNQGLDPLDDVTRLEGRVKRLARPVKVLANGYRGLSGNSPGGLLIALLSELDETVLPRKIKVVANTEQSVILHVANCRLLKIDLPDRQMGTCESQAAGAVEMIAQLQEILAGATRAVVRSERIAPDPAQADAGCKVTALIAQVPVKLTTPQEQDSVEALFSALVSTLVGWISLDPSGHPMERGGDPSWCRRLDHLARSGLADIDAQLIQSLADPDQPGCVLLNSGGTDGFVLVYARSKHAGFLAALRSDDMARIQPAWRAFYG